MSKSFLGKLSLKGPVRQHWGRNVINYKTKRSSGSRTLPRARCSGGGYYYYYYYYYIDKRLASSSTCI
jgi:hypothetical protein